MINFILCNLSISTLKVISSCSRCDLFNLHFAHFAFADVFIELFDDGLPELSSLFIFKYRAGLNILQNKVLIFAESTNGNLIFSHFFEIIKDFGFTGEHLISFIDFTLVYLDVSCYLSLNYPGIGSLFLLNITSQFKNLFLQFEDFTLAIGDLFFPVCDYQFQLLNLIAQFQIVSFVLL